jgi:hypothetical protein
LRQVLGGAVISVALVFGAALPAQADVRAPATRPGARYFGMHYGSIGLDGSYPATRAIGSVRLWDTGTTWRHVQPERRVWNWTVLDRAVRTARKHNASVLYVFGSTPAWAATDPRGGLGLYGAGATSPPRQLKDWVAYVRAVAHRYKGRIQAYELWNEANLVTFSSISPTRMATMASLAYRAIKRIDHRAVVTSPSVTVRGGGGLVWMRRFARAGGLRWADVVNLHLYPRKDVAPEQGAYLFRKFRDALHKVGVSKPYWNTEMNYGLPWHGRPRLQRITGKQQVAYVLRSYVLGWSVGLRRQYWYDWSASSFLGVKMTSPDGLRPSPAGAAFGRARTWLSGAMAPCRIDRYGTYRCVVTYRRGTGVITWNARHRTTVAPPPGARGYTDQNGRFHSLQPGQRLRLGQYPVRFLVG